MRKFYRGPSIDNSCKKVLYLAKRFQRRIFLVIDQPEPRILYGGHVCLQIERKWAIFLKDLQ
jgi:hypothetical protein